MPSCNVGGREEGRGSMQFRTDACRNSERRQAAAAKQTRLLNERSCTKRWSPGCVSSTVSVVALLHKQSASGVDVNAT